MGAGFTLSDAGVESGVRNLWNHAVNVPPVSLEMILQIECIVVAAALDASKSR